MYALKQKICNELQETAIGQIYSQSKSDSTEHNGFEPQTISQQEHFQQECPTQERGPFIDASPRQVPKLSPTSYAPRTDERFLQLDKHLARSGPIEESARVARSDAKQTQVVQTTVDLAEKGEQRRREGRARENTEASSRARAVHGIRAEEKVGYIPCRGRSLHRASDKDTRALTDEAVEQAESDLPEQAADAWATKSGCQKCLLCQQTNRACWTSPANA